MSFVADASVVMRWLLPTQADAVSAAILNRAVRERIVVPGLWHLEIANQLGLRLRAGKISQDVIERAIALLANLDIETSPSPFNSPQPLLALMARHELTAYDAIYLDLAESRALPLATFDRKLITAAHSAGIDLIG